MINLDKRPAIFIVHIAAVFFTFACVSSLNNEGAESAEQTVPDFFGDERRLADPADFWEIISKAWQSRDRSAAAVSSNGQVAVKENDSQLHPPLPVRGHRLNNNGDFNRRRIGPTYNRLFGFYTNRPNANNNPNSPNGNNSPNSPNGNKNPNSPNRNSPNSPNSNNNNNSPNKPPTTFKPILINAVVNKINDVFNDDFDRYNSVLENRALKRKEGQEYSLQRDNSDFFGHFGRRGNRGPNRRDNFFIF